MYGKLFGSMFEGSLYGNWQAIVTLQQMVILCDANGELDMTPAALSARTSIPIEIIGEGLRQLALPDPISRTKEEDGRRIVLLDPDRPWGWRIVNYKHYRDLRDLESKRAYDRQYRRRERATGTTVGDVVPSRPGSSHVEVEVEAELPPTSLRSVGDQPLLDGLGVDAPAQPTTGRAKRPPQATQDRRGPSGASPPSWVQRIVDRIESLGDPIRGSNPYGRVGAAFKRRVERFGEDVVLTALGRFVLKRAEDLASDRSVRTGYAFEDFDRDFSQYVPLDLLTSTGDPT